MHGLRGLRVIDFSDRIAGAYGQAAADEIAAALGG